MNAPEYLQKVSDQIAVSGIRDEIRKELNAHLEDQKEAFMMDGMDEKEAEEAAVLEMGDPVEVGIQLNEVHKPKPVKKYVNIFLGFNVFWFLLNSIAYIRSDGAAVGGIRSLLLILLLFLFWAFYLSIVYGWKKRKKEYRSPFSFIGFLTCYGVGCAIMHKIKYGSLDEFNKGILFIFDTDTRGFHSLLFFSLEFLLLLTMIRKSKTFCSDTIVLWIFMYMPAVYLLWEHLFMLLEITGIYAGIFTLVYIRNWFPKRLKCILFLYWSVPGVCVLKLLNLFLIKRESVMISPVAIPGNPEYTFLYDICRCFGSFPAYVVLLLGILAEVQLFLLFHKMRSEWGKLLTFAVVLIGGVLVINGGLSLMGVLPQEYVFTPFLWKAGSSYTMGEDYNLMISAGEIDYVQILLYYVLTGYLTRFISRDSLLNLEMEAAKTEAQKRSDKKSNKKSKKNLGFLRKSY